MHPRANRRRLCQKFAAGSFAVLLFLSDRQLTLIAEASRPLPAQKKSLLWVRTMARLNVISTGPKVRAADVESAIGIALRGLESSARAAEE